MHWLGPFQLFYINEAGSSKLEKLQGQTPKGLIKESRLKVYYGPQESTIIYLPLSALNVTRVGLV